MFSGLIAHRARVVSFEGDAARGARLVLAAAGALAEGVVPKDSIAVNGVCLTATSVVGDRIAFDVVPETLVRSTLGSLRADDVVNLELSLKLGERMGGHLVYGHVDATARVESKVVEGQGHRLRIEMPATLGPYIVEKGYVAIDGVSLTVAAVRDGCFEIALIPETSQRTTLGVRDAGSRVNVEIDPVARYAVAAILYRERDDSPTHEEIEWAYEI